MEQSRNYHFEDFTEARYRELLKIAKAKWTFIPYSEFRTKGRVCLWRHDVDFSVHRAHAMAVMEAKEGLRATYFINLHSIFYNPLEGEITQLIHRIRNLGHSLGLHFDPGYYASRHEDTDPKGCEMKDTPFEMERAMALEKSFLEAVFETEFSAFSFHNPDLGPWFSIDQDEIAGMVNAYGRYIREHYDYISDSNGYWRFRRLRDVLDAGAGEKLHILTHSGWWTPEILSPRERVSRCINGRALKQHRLYDRLLADADRENIGKTVGEWPAIR